MVSVSRALFLSRALQAAAASRSVRTLLRPLPAAAAPGAAVRCFANQPETSSLRERDSSQNWSRRPPKEQFTFPGCDFEHWLVTMEPPPGDASNPDITRDEIIDSYIKTLAQVVGRNYYRGLATTGCWSAMGDKRQTRSSLTLSDITNIIGQDKPDDEERIKREEKNRKQREYRAWKRAEETK